MFLYFNNKVGLLDDSAYKIITMFKSETLTSIMKLVTMLGGGIAVLILANICLLVDKKKGLYFILNIAIVILLNLIIKNIVMRDRPIGINLILEDGYSFPSGHSMTSAATYGLIAVYLLHSRKNNYIKTIGIILSILLVILIPISRVYLGVHYFSDVLAGTSISVIWLVIYSEYLKKKGI